MGFRMVWLQTNIFFQGLWLHWSAPQWSCNTLCGQTPQKINMYLHNGQKVTYLRETISPLISKSIFLKFYIDTSVAYQERSQQGDECGCAYTHTHATCISIMCILQRVYIYTHLLMDGKVHPSYMFLLKYIHPPTA